MTTYFRMPKELWVVYRNELSAFQAYLDRGDLDQAWRHLERAHIVGQPWAVEHTMVHWKMLKFGFRIKSTREIIGQIPRLLVGGVKSFVGRIPVGNTGGANVHPLKPMEIPADLKEAMKMR